MSADLSCMSLKELEDLSLEISFAMSRHVPEMEAKGFRIQTNLGEVDIGPGTPIPKLLSRLLEAKLKRVDAEVMARRGA